MYIYNNIYQYLWLITYAASIPFKYKYPFWKSTDHTHTLETIKFVGYGRIKMVWNNRVYLNVLTVQKHFGV